MKMYLVMLAVMLAFIPIVMAEGSSGCPGPDCGYNVITQSNTAIADSGKPVYCSECKDSKDVLALEQTQTNCAAVLGEGNKVDQTNHADAAGVLLTQMQKNIGMVVGADNTLDQSNEAKADGIKDGRDQDHGFSIDQSQKNLGLIIGENNRATQENEAKAYDASTPDKKFPISQTQTNMAVILGAKNKVNQENEATATMDKTIEIDPKITQIQKNLAFAINNCNTPRVSTKFTGIKTVEWPEVKVVAPAYPQIACQESGEGC